MAKLVDAIVSGAIGGYSLYKFKSCCSHYQSVAQLVACRHRESKVTGSNPVSLILVSLVGYFYLK